jgi:hypothetical protein
MMMTGVNNDMVQLKVIRPYKIKGDVSCARCDLSYSKRDYNILYKNEKLVYFDITLKEKTRLICHDCFYKFLKVKSQNENDEDFAVQVTDGNKKFIITVTNKLDDDDENGFLL